MIGNPDVISPTVYLTPEILKYKSKTIVRIHVPPSSEVHSYKKVIFDRVNDADIKVTATSQIAAMYIRKQSIFTEKKIYPYVKDEHLRFDLLPRVRQTAVNRYQEHPWKDMSDAELLQSAGLIGEDMATGEKGYNLAAVMLLGKDDVIRSVSPAYRTDAIMRKINTDRYDDRLIVQTNLIESYEQLTKFSEKHLWDKFYLEKDMRISLRSIITREMLVNTLIHREYTSSYIAKFVIEKDRMFTENANRAVSGGVITPENFEPNPKNPTIAAFFRNIWLADELGSGVRKLYHYVPRYSGKPPELIDGDVFRIIVPLDDEYSFEVKKDKVQLKVSDCPLSCTTNCTLTEKAILEFLRDNATATQTEIAAAVGKSLRTVKADMAALQEKGLLKREGARKNGRWVVIDSDSYCSSKNKEVT
ncbi:MAG: winged helix-turn-helix transcriptional regulator [Oscillospiraceae bacterium]|nr:winged helix-turn-helix transcriptional regulator [Oscillospiraceae bacterium]